MSGKKILLLPVLMKKGFDTSSLSDPLSLIKWAKREREDIVLINGNYMPKEYLRRYGSDSLKRLCDDLYSGNVLEIQTNDSLFGLIKEQLMMVTRFKGGSRIKSLDNNIVIRLSIEMELWDIGKAETIWRVAVTGTSVDSSIVDRDFFVNARKEGLKALPRVHGKAVVDLNW